MDIRSAKLKLPYLSSAFPDELLGSWFSRLVILNAEPSLLSFSRAIGLDLHTKSVAADPLNGANYIRAISELLGYEYEAMLASFTTKSYWETFRPKKQSVSQQAYGGLVPLDFLHRCSVSVLNALRMIVELKGGLIFIAHISFEAEHVPIMGCYCKTVVYVVK
jgi:hypothetical protein